MSEFTEYQKMMARAYGVDEKYFPAEEPAEELDVSGGYKRGTGWNGRIVGPPETPEQERERLASIYGVQAKYMPLPEGEAENE